MRALIKTAAVRFWAALHGVTARNSWRALPAIEARAGFEGVLLALEESHGHGATALLGARGARVGERVRLLRGLTIHNADGDFSALTIGNGCHIGRQVFVDLAAPVTLGERVTLSMRTMILTHTSVGDSLSAIGRGAERRSPVAVEDDVYVGAGAIILPGVTLGKRAVVAAGAVVTRSVQPDTLVAGIPARAIGDSRVTTAERGS
jgi:maltose O-acetyltransferase